MELPQCRYRSPPWGSAFEPRGVTLREDFVPAARLGLMRAHLLVCDSMNNRVLIYNTIPTSNNAAADVVIGQADRLRPGQSRGPPFGENPQHARGYLCQRWKDICLHAYNSRSWFITPSLRVTTPPADLVIGQTSMAATQINQGGWLLLGPECPLWCWGDGQKLFVADTANHRSSIQFGSALERANADRSLGNPISTANFVIAWITGGCPTIGRFGGASFDGAARVTCLSPILSIQETVLS
jgi:hypothetical protein